MTSETLQAQALRAAQVFKKLAIRQEVVAAAVGASQSQVSRVLAGRLARSSKLFRSICVYADSIGQGVSLDAVRANSELVEALAVTWDGSAEHSQALAAVIRSLAVLRPSQSTDNAQSQ